MTETYVDPDQALFEIQLWNQFNDNDNIRSNNDEGYNLWLSLWLHKHPNIQAFIKKIKSEESSTYLKYYNINRNTFKIKTQKPQGYDKTQGY